jgi:hypothetical protein
MSSCLYCRNQPTSLEHPLPAAFGEFKNAPLLGHRVCTSCNNTRLGLLDEQLSRCGPEAVLRRFFGLQGRTTHDKVNPHYRGSAGGHRLEMKAYDTSMGIQVELECLKGQVRQSRQLVVVETSGKTHNIPISDNLRDPAKLRAAYLGLGVTQPADVRLVYDPEELVWLEPLFKTAFPTASFQERGLGAKNYEKGAVVKLQLTDRYFRAIAKIGFHYFLTQFPVFDGSEPCFSEIRHFIIEDGSVTRVNTFIGERAHPLLGQMIDGARPDGWIAHVLAAEITPEACLAYVQLFVCKDYRAPVYAVRLSANADNTLIRASGHAYKYFEEGPKGKFAGEAHALGVTRISAAPPPLKPVVRDSPESSTPLGGG